MNRKGFTLVEELAAVMIFVTVVSVFSYLLKESGRATLISKKRWEELCCARGEMEKARRLPFDKLLSANSDKVKVFPASADLMFIQVGKLTTLRSKY